MEGRGVEGTGKEEEETVVGESLECEAVEMLMIFSHCGRFSVTESIICCTVPYILMWVILLIVCGVSKS